VREMSSESAFAKRRGASQSFLLPVPAHLPQPAPARARNLTSASAPAR
jgi:hypothetical protein